MRMLQAALTLIAALVYAEYSTANPLTQAAKNGVHSADVVFSRLPKSSQMILKGQYDQAPTEVRGLVSSNYKVYDNEQYFKMSQDGRAAHVISPNRSDDLTGASITAVHTEPGTNYTMHFTVKSKDPSPSMLELPYHHETRSPVLNDNHFEYSLGRTRDDHTGMDMVPSVPVRFSYNLPNDEMERFKVFTVIGESRYTMMSELKVEPKRRTNRIHEREVTLADGTKEMMDDPDLLSLQARMHRTAPDRPIDTAILTLRLREQYGSSLVYKVPKSQSGVEQSIQDIRFNDIRGSDEQFMEVITSERERITYKIEKDGDKVKLVHKSTVPKIDMTEFKASKAPLKERQAVENSGPKGIEIEAGR